MRVKICGLTTPEALVAAVEAGAAYVGMTFYPRSPRNLSLAAAAEIASGAPPGVCKVALIVDADDAQIDALLRDVPIDMLQLHGAESPARVAELRARTGLPVMKAVSIADADDLPRLVEYGRIADQLLCDAKPPKTHQGLPGGNGVSFDWGLIQGRRWPVPWMLAGGLTPDNVAAAVRLTGARQVDVSTGVESAPGVKDARMIRAFVAAARAAVQAPDAPRSGREDAT